MSKETQIKQVREAYIRIRTIDHTISDDILDIMKDAAIEKLSQSSQPKGAEEVKEGVIEELWNKFSIEYNEMSYEGFQKAMQSYASQQLSEKDKEIGSLSAFQKIKGNIKPENMLVVEKEVREYWQEQCAVKDKEIAELKKSQQPDDNAFEQFYLWKRERSIRGESPISFTHWYRTEYLKPEPQPVQGESDGWIRVGERLPTKEDADENGKVL
jgi:hypothetical protein